MIKDGHGDILSVYGSNGTTKLASYIWLHRRAANEVCDQPRYDAFGNQLTTSGTWAASNPIRYCGEYYDTETGLIYLRARYYDSESGRFLNADSYWNIENMIYDGENISVANILQSNNLYNYCMGNPVMYSDPTGNNIYERLIAIYDIVDGAMTIGSFVLSYEKVIEYMSSIYYHAANVYNAEKIGDYGTYTQVNGIYDYTGYNQDIQNLNQILKIQSPALFKEESFTNLSSEEQAEFINELKVIDNRYCAQIAVTLGKDLSKKGIDIAY